MVLSNCKFYRAGEKMNFSIFADKPCQARYIDSVSTPLTNTKLEVYAIHPSYDTQWLVIQQREGKVQRIRLFVRKGSEFVENPAEQIPTELKRRIALRFPVLTMALGLPIAA
jgi:hypothetical protein